MKNIYQKFLRVAVIVLFGVLLSSSIAAAAEPIDQVRTLVDKYYIKEVPAWVLEAENVDEMLSRLGDEHSAYFTAEEYQEFVGSINQEFSGIGVYIEARPEGIVVLSVIQGSPAEEAGLCEGDIIIQAEGVTLANSSNEKAASIIRGTEGTPVHLTVERHGKQLEFKVIRRKIQVPTVTYELLESGIGYIDIDSFGIETYEKVRQAVEELRRRGAATWIVDLRNNSGGYLDTAWQIAGLFVDDKPVVRWHQRNLTLLYRGLDHETPVSGPVVVLVNEYSASAAEILAGALKDHNAAVLVGSTTFGKGTGQSLFRLSNGDVLKLTVAEFRTPNGGRVEDVGISPHFDAADAKCLDFARLLLLAANQSAAGAAYKVCIGEREFYFSTQLIEEQWGEWMQLLKSLPVGSLYRSKNNSWAPVTQYELEHDALVLFPNSYVLSELVGQSERCGFLFRVGRENAAKLPQAVLIDTETGANLEVETSWNYGGIMIRINSRLTEGGSYWLVIENGPFKKRTIVPFRLKMAG